MKKRVAVSKAKHYVIEKFLHPLNLWGAKPIGTDLVGNIILKMNRKTSLGERGDLLHIPDDGHILNNVKKYSVWAGEEVEFLIERQKIISNRNPSEIVTFIDLGAHCGLITRQFVLETSFEGRIILVEPVLQHAFAIRKNLSKITRSSNVQVIEAALGIADGKSKIFKEIRNSGNASLFKGLTDENLRTTSDIFVISASEFSKTVAANPGLIILKSDLQGFDAKVLARFSNIFWNILDSAVVEVLAISEIDKSDVEIIVERLKDFKYFSWKPKKEMSITLEEIRIFWLSKSGEQRNLYFSRSII